MVDALPEVNSCPAQVLRSARDALRKPRAQTRSFEGPAIDIAVKEEELDNETSGDMLRQSVQC